MTTFKRDADFQTRGWGLSMYGGWYINYFNGGEYSGVGGKTLKECMAQLGITKADLKTGDVILRRGGAVEIVNRDLKSHNRYDN